MREISNADFDLIVEALTRYVRQPPLSGAGLKEENLMRRVRVMLKRLKRKSNER